LPKPDTLFLIFPPLFSFDPHFFFFSREILPRNGGISWTLVETSPDLPPLFPHGNFLTYLTRAPELCPVFFPHYRRFVFLFWGLGEVFFCDELEGCFFLLKRITSFQTSHLLPFFLALWLYASCRPSFEIPPWFFTVSPAMGGFPPPDVLVEISLGPFVCLASTDCLFFFPPPPKSYFPQSPGLFTCSPRTFPDDRTPLSFLNPIPRFPPPRKSTADPPLFFTTGTETPSLLTT